jgi:hypothetical protein
MTLARYTAADLSIMRSLQLWRPSGGQSTIPSSSLAEGPILEMGLRHEPKQKGFRAANRL